jgi:copper chaperone CopZ
MGNRGVDTGGGAKGPINILIYPQALFILGQEEPPVTQISLTISGMSCGHCLNAVNRALSALPGVQVGEVQIGRAELSYDPAVTDTEQIVDAVRLAGYESVVAI